MRVEVSDVALLSQKFSRDNNNNNPNKLDVENSPNSRSTRLMPLQPENPPLQFAEQDQYYKLASEPEQSYLSPDHDNLMFQQSFEPPPRPFEGPPHHLMPGPPPGSPFASGPGPGDPGQFQRDGPLFRSAYHPVHHSMPPSPGFAQQGPPGSQGPPGHFGHPGLTLVSQNSPFPPLRRGPPLGMMPPGAGGPMQPGPPMAFGFLPEYRIHDLNKRLQQRVEVSHQYHSFHRQFMFIVLVGLKFLANTQKKYNFRYYIFFKVHCFPMNVSDWARCCVVFVIAVSLYSIIEFLNFFL